VRGALSNERPYRDHPIRKIAAAQNGALPSSAGQVFEGVELFAVSRADAG
jgi:hypothetical protein